MSSEFINRAPFQNGDLTLSKELAVTKVNEKY